jgi:hypothetical protein
MPSEGNAVRFQDFLAVQEQEFPFRFEHKHMIGRGRRRQGASGRWTGLYGKSQKYHERDGSEPSHLHQPLSTRLHYERAWTYFTLPGKRDFLANIRVCKELLCGG